MSRLRAAPARGPTELDTYFERLIARVADVPQPSQEAAALTPAHLVHLAEDLAVRPDDEWLYLITWKLECKEPMKIKRDEWVAGFAAMRLSTLTELKTTLRHFRSDVEAPSNYKSFYFFVFDWVRDNNMARSIANDVALQMWPVVFSVMRPPWPLANSWLDFVGRVGKKPISRDVWRQLLEYVRVDPLQQDPNGSWPSLMDDFAEFLRRGPQPQ